MTWTRLSDDFIDRPDLLEVSRSARLLHIEALVYCNRQLLDGRLPARALRRVTDTEAPDADVQELIDVGLWQAYDGGWLVDWADQEAGADVKRRRRNTLQRQQRHRRHIAGDHQDCNPQRCRGARDAARDQTSDVTRDTTPSRPGPARPGPKEPGPGRPRLRHHMFDDTTEDGCCSLPARHPVHQLAG